MEQEIKDQATDTIQSILIDALTDIHESAKGAKDFVLEQAPDIVQQYLVWYIAENVVELVISFLIAGVLFGVAKHFVTKLSKSYDNLPDTDRRLFDKADNTILSTLIKIFGMFIIPLIIICMSTASNGVNIAKGVYAPKIVILESAAHVVKYGTLPNP